MEWEQDAWSSWNICMYVLDRIHGRSHGRRWSNYEGNWLQFPTTKGPACLPWQRVEIDSSHRFRYIKCNHLTTGRKYFHPLCPNNAVRSPSLSLSLAVSFYRCDSPPKRSECAWCEGSPLTLPLPLSLSASSLFVRSWLLVQGAGDNCSLVANISMPFPCLSCPVE